MFVSEQNVTSLCPLNIEVKCTITLFWNHNPHPTLVVGAHFEVWSFVTMRITVFLGHSAFVSDVTFYRPNLVESSLSCQSGKIRKFPSTCSFLKMIRST